MTQEDVLQELQREPFIPLRLHLSSGQKMDIEYPNSAFTRQNRLVIMHRLSPGSPAIGNYDVVAYRLIERIETLESGGSAKSSRRRRKAS